MSRSEWAWFILGYVKAASEGSTEHFAESLGITPFILGRKVRTARKWGLLTPAGVEPVELTEDGLSEVAWAETLEKRMDATIRRFTEE